MKMNLILRQVWVVCSELILLKACQGLYKLSAQVQLTFSVIEVNIINVIHS